MARIVIEEPCEHGKMGQHLLAERRFDGCDLCRSGEHGYPGDPHFDCPGGSRRVLDPGSYVLIEADYDMVRVAAANVLARTQGMALERQVDAIFERLDALAGGEQP